MNKEEFFKSPRGKIWFKEKTKGMERHARYALKKWIINPPKYVLRWIWWNDEVNKEMEKEKWNE